MKDPAFLFYYQDFAYGTRRMSCEEKGCYIELLCEQADSGHLPLKEIMRILGESFIIWDSICNKFIADKDGNFYNVILEEHLMKRRKYTESRKKNLKGSHKAKHMKPHMVNANESVNKNVTINTTDNNLKKTFLLSARTAQMIEIVIKIKITIIKL